MRASTARSRTVSSTCRRRRSGCSPRRRACCGRPAGWRSPTSSASSSSRSRSSVTPTCGRRASAAPRRRARTATRSRPPVFASRRSARTPTNSSPSVRAPPAPVRRQDHLSGSRSSPAAEPAPARHQRGTPMATVTHGPTTVAATERCALAPLSWGSPPWVHRVKLRHARPPRPHLPGDRRVRRRGAVGGTRRTRLIPRTGPIERRDIQVSRRSTGATLMQPPRSWRSRRGLHPSHWGLRRCRAWIPSPCRAGSGRNGPRSRSSCSSRQP